MIPSPIDRFMDKVSPEPMSGCWLWMAAVDQKGYGLFSTPDTTKAHRASWSFFRGRLPVDLFVCHRCDNPGCVNPDHLFLGTAADNMRDKVEKGRSFTPRGEANGSAKLTDAQAEHIRVLLSTKVVRQCEIALAFGVSQAQISRIKTGLRRALA